MLWPYSSNAVTSGVLPYLKYTTILVFCQYSFLKNFIYPKITITVNIKKRALRVQLHSENVLAGRKKCNFPHFSTVKSAIFCTKKNADRWLRYANHQDLGCGYLLLLYNIDNCLHPLFVEVNCLAFKISYTKIKDWKLKRKEKRRRGWF